MRLPDLVSLPILNSDSLTKKTARQNFSERFFDGVIHVTMEWANRCPATRFLLCDNHLTPCLNQNGQDFWIFRISTRPVIRAKPISHPLCNNSHFAYRYAQNLPRLGFSHRSANSIREGKTVEITNATILSSHRVLAPFVRTRARWLEEPWVFLIGRDL